MELSSSVEGERIELRFVESGVAGQERNRGGAPALRVEQVPARIMVGHQIAWQNLCDQAIEKNVFLEPAFALPLAQHAMTRRRPDFLLVWEENGSASFGRLIGLLPILPPSPLIPGIIRGFFDDHVKLGTPLLDRERGGEAWEGMLIWLRAEMPGAVALRLCGIDADGPVHALLSRHAEATSRGLLRFDAHRRAVLQRGAKGESNVMPLVHTKKRKEIGRQRRRLSERGTRTYSSAMSPEEVARAAERFLALEHNGWKGQRGTALLATPALATFTRSMTRQMAHEGKCRIDSIEIDGIAVAMGIVLTIGDRAHFWKTTFHEAYAPLSPGVQFALELTERQLAESGVALTDSCAIPDHPMIDRLWAGRMHVTDVLIALDPAAPGRFARAARLERFARALRAKAKAAHGRMRRALRTG